MGGRSGGSGMGGKLFTPPSKGYFTRKEYDKELNKLASKLKQATNSKERGKVYKAMEELEKVKVVN